MKRQNRIQQRYVTSLNPNGVADCILCLLWSPQINRNGLARSWIGLMLSKYWAKRKTGNSYCDWRLTSLMSALLKRWWYFVFASSMTLSLLFSNHFNLDLPHFGSLCLADGTDGTWSCWYHWHDKPSTQASNTNGSRMTEKQRWVLIFEFRKQ